MSTNDDGNPMHTIYQSHDAYGRSSLKYQAIMIDCLRGRLETELLERINFDTLEFISPNFIIGEQLAQCQSDVICRVSIDNNDDKADAIYLIIELQSTPDRYMAKRLYKYRLLLALDHGIEHETEIMPFVRLICMYNGQKAYPYSTYLCDCVTYPELARKDGMLDQFELWDLSQSTIDELLQKGGRAGFFQALLKQGIAGEFIEVLQKVTPAYIQQLPPDHVYSSAVYIYHNSKLEQGKECLRLLSELIREKTVKEEVMSYADSLRYEGIAEGKQLGIVEGRQLGVEEGILQTAKNLLRQGVEMGTILLATGLQREQLLQLQRCLRVTH
ncbi:MAG: Rpn family recombination-promoting nuclease/putative transposase [Bacteroidota bacterium]